MSRAQFVIGLRGLIGRENDCLLDDSIYHGAHEIHLVECEWYSGGS